MLNNNFKPFFKNLIALIKKRVPHFSLKTIIIFTILNAVFLVFFRHALIILAIFLVCTLILVKYGKLPFADIDPVPFFASLIFLAHGFFPAWDFILWTIPISDAIAARLNHYSIINFISLSISLLAANLLKGNLFITYVIILLLFNLVRMFINFSIGLGLKALIAPVTNFLIYLILGSILSPVLETGIVFFSKL